jgi:alpha-glucosidase (family GH31 glycosyl hydrolase)
LYPIYTAFPSESTSESVTEVVFGSSLIATFNFEQGSTTRDITLPKENNWLNLNNF